MGKSRLSKKREADRLDIHLPWFIGFLLLFVQPMVSFFRYSFYQFAFEGDGFVLKPLENGIWGQYIQALTGDAEFPRLFSRRSGISSTRCRLSCFSACSPPPSSTRNFTAA